jgi:ATP-dependent HslUV protease ATP-binding subunit HslU
MEKLLEQISFEAGNTAAAELRIDAAYVDEKLGAVARDEDLARYVL